MEYPVAAPGSAPTIVCPSVSSLPSSIPKTLTFDGSGAPDLLLKQHHAVKQRFSRRRAARNIDINGHDAVAAAHHRIRIMIVTAAIGAGSHRDHIARLRHLVVD